MNTNKTYQIKVIARNCKCKDGRTFVAYRAVQKDGTLIDCRFRRSVTDIPTSNFIMTVNHGDANISKAREFPCLWVSAVVSFEPVPRNAAEGEDLPF